MTQGCATLGPSYKDFVPSSQDTKKNKVLLTQTPFIHQKDNYCGPAALSMVLQNNGVFPNYPSIIQKVYIPQKKGTHGVDIVGASRRFKQMVFTLKNPKDLFVEIANGNPVLILQNLSLQIFPKYHYAVVTGYDLQEEEIYLHGFEKPHHTLKLKTFFNTWKRSKFWGVVILPAGKLAHTATVNESVESASMLEKLGFSTEAILAYNSILVRWEDAYQAYLGLSNAYYLQQQKEKAVGILLKANEKFPENIFIMNNLANIFYELGHKSKAQDFAKDTLRLLEKERNALVNVKDLEHILQN